MTQHLTFIRKFEKVAIIVAVVDADDFKNIPNESFVVSTTSKNIYTGNLPSIQLSEQVFINEDQQVKGNSIDGILTSPHWFIRKIKTGLESIIGS